MSRLALPPHFVVRFNVWNNTHCVDLDAFFAALLTSIHCHADSTLGSSNAITSLEVTQVDWVLDNAVVAHKESTSGSDRELALVINFRGFTAPGHAWLKTFTSVHLTELKIGHNAPHDEHAWRDNMQGRRDLAVCRTATCRRHWLYRSQPPSTPPRPQCFLPTLSVLIISGVCVARDPWEAAPSSTHLHTSTCQGGGRQGTAVISRDCPPHAATHTLGRAPQRPFPSPLHSFPLQFLTFQLHVSAWLASQVKCRAATH
ncbi:hypothetical protein FA95DRAFT_1684451, partial [Auriscalpium vulgare]